MPAFARSGEIMASTKRRYDKEEFARRGDAVYETEVRPRLAPDDEGKFAAIDIETGTYVVDGDELAAVQRLHARLAEAQVWVVRIGSRAVHRFGGRDRRNVP
jgi:23S rRNA maturation mini-RNase III